MKYSEKLKNPCECNTVRTKLNRRRSVISSEHDAVSVLHHNLSYSEKLKDPRWQKKRLEILERDGWRCVLCENTEATLHVHHRRYFHGKDPWEYPSNLLSTLCENCHESEREMRKEYESDLLEILREKFWADDIYHLADGFRLIELQDKHDVVSWALRVGLANNELQKQLINNTKTTDDE
jgi:5-methylcytosine-specific restriction endonuclease McrA